MSVDLGPAPTGRGGPPLTAAERVGVLLDRVWGAVVTATPITFVVGLVFLTVARCGVATHFREMGNWALLSREFPRVVSDWRANSVVGPAVGHAFGVDSAYGWITLHGVITVLVAVGVCVAIRQRFATTASRRVVATWLALSSVAPSLLQKIGSYDVYTVSGALLVVWGRRRWAAVAGGALLGATSAEQGALGLVAAAVVTVLAVRPDDPAVRPTLAEVRSHPLVARLALALGALVVVRVGILLWFAGAGVDVPTRGDVLTIWLVESLEKSAGASAGGVYAWFGGAWGLVALAWAITHWSGRRWALVGVALILVPAVVSVTTLDGSRVFAMVSLPAMLALLAWVVERAEADGATARLVYRATAAALLVAPVLPALITDPNGGASFMVPWRT